MSSIQTKLFQVVVDFTASATQPAVDAARMNLQNQVNGFLNTLALVDVAEVRFHEGSAAKYGPDTIFTAEVIYVQA